MQVLNELKNEFLRSDPQGMSEMKMRELSDLDMVSNYRGQIQSQADEVASAFGFSKGKKQNFT